MKWGGKELSGVSAPDVTKCRARAMIKNSLRSITNLSKRLYSSLTWVFTGMKSVGFHRN